MAQPLLNGFTITNSGALMDFCRRSIVFALVLTLSFSAGAGASVKGKAMALICTALLGGFVLAPDTPQDLDSRSVADIFTVQMDQDFSKFGSSIANVASVSVGALTNGAEMVAANWVNVSDYLQGQNGVLIWLSDAKTNASKVYSDIGSWTFETQGGLVVRGIHNQVLNDLSAVNAVMVLFKSDQVSERGQAVGKLSAVSARALDVTLGVGGIMLIGAGFKFPLKRSGSGQVVAQSDRASSNSYRPTLKQMNIKARLSRQVNYGGYPNNTELAGRSAIGQEYLARLETSDASFEISEFPDIKFELKQSVSYGGTGAFYIASPWSSKLSDDMREDIDLSLQSFADFIKLMRQSFFLELKVRDSLDLLWHVHGFKFKTKFGDRDIQRLAADVSRHLQHLIHFKLSHADQKEPIKSLRLTMESKFESNNYQRNHGERPYNPSEILNDFIDGILRDIPGAEYDSYTGQELLRYGSYINTSRNFIDTLMRSLSENGVDVGTYKVNNVVNFAKTRKVLESFKL